MNNKQEILAMLNEEYKRWEELLAGLKEEQITARHLPANLSIKDVIGHLRAWQQVTLARLEAALLEREPQLPAWLAGEDPESDDHLEEFNARIHETYREQPWSSVHQDWRDGFLRVLELGETIPGKDLLDPEKYPWLEGHPLIFVLTGTHEHHHDDHLEPLLDWFDQQ
ncbi:MAG: ClbS/DfsB family four-helix bundle protein [Anaerolineales bacterium]|jgi:hypothetical protein